MIKIEIHNDFILIIKLSILSLIFIISNRHILDIIFQKSKIKLKPQKAVGDQNLDKSLVRCKC
jgi:hypothetical protein